MPRSAVVYIIAIIAVALAILLGVVMWKGITTAKKEHYNGGNNIDFDKVKNDSDIPEDALAKGDVFFKGGRFSYIMN